MGYHIRVKVCGLTVADDVREAVRLGADAIGLNFHPASPRSIAPERATALLRCLSPFVEAVGVFVRKSVDEARDILNPLGRIRTIQVHGEPHQIADAFPYHFIPAFQVRDASDRNLIESYLDACRSAGQLPSAILVDGHAPGLLGGTGQKAAWHVLAGWNPGVPLILAGGLTPDNVAEAVSAVRPWGIDVASGVESSPGRKDAQCMRAFIERAREAARTL